MNAEFKDLFNRSKLVANDVYRHVRHIKDITHSQSCQFSLIANGLALNLRSERYRGCIFITAGVLKNSYKVSFAPIRRDPVYIKTCTQYLELFDKLLNIK